VHLIYLHEEEDKRHRETVKRHRMNWEAQRAVPPDSVENDR
jgi:hypothetical protein